MDGKKDLSSKIRHWCARSERSPEQVRRKLYAWGARDGIEQAIEALIQDGYLDARRFAEAYAADHVRLKGWGPAKVAAGLRVEHGISADLVDRALGLVSSEDVLDAACRAVRKRKLHRPDEDPSKAIASLLRKGFNFDVARKAVSAEDAPPKFGPSC